MSPHSVVETCRSGFGAASIFLLLHHRAAGTGDTWGATAAKIQSWTRPTLALSACDFAYIMMTGEIRLCGTAAELAAKDDLIKSYLGA